ncbi:hypothetical protein AB4521_23360 [Vibrio cyclitrophicus]
MTDLTNNILINEVVMLRKKYSDDNFTGNMNLVCHFDSIRMKNDFTGSAAYLPFYDKNLDFSFTAIVELEEADTATTIKVYSMIESLIDFLESERDIDIHNSQLLKQLETDIRSEPSKFPNEKVDKFIKNYFYDNSIELEKDCVIKNISLSKEDAYRLEKMLDKKGYSSEELFFSYQHKLDELIKDKLISFKKPELDF